MAKRNKLIFVIMVLAVCMSLVMALAGCDNGENTTTTDITWGEWTLDVVPTESSAGTIIRTNEENNLVERVELPKIDRDNYSVEVVTPATCTATGKTKYTLKNSDKSVSFEVVTPVTPHTYGEWIIDGVNRHYRVCSKCGAREYEDADIVWSDWRVEVVPTDRSDGTIIRTNEVNNLVDRAEIPYINCVDYDSEIIIDATCTTAGKTKYTLKDSDKAVSFEVVTPATQHSYGQWIIDGANKRYRICSKCGDKQYEDNKDSLYVGRDVTSVDIIDYVIWLTGSAKYIKEDYALYVGDNAPYEVDIEATRDITMLRIGMTSDYTRVYNGTQYGYSYNENTHKYTCIRSNDEPNNAMQGLLVYLTNLRSASDLAYDAKGDKFTAMLEGYEFSLKLVSDGYIMEYSKGNERTVTRVYDFNVPVDIKLPTNVAYDTSWRVDVQPTYNSTGLATRQDDTEFGVVVEYVLPIFSELEYQYVSTKTDNNVVLSYNYRIKDDTGEYINVTIDPNNMALARAFDAYNYVARAKSFVVEYRELDNNDTHHMHFFGDKLMYDRDQTEIYSDVGAGSILAKKNADASTKDYYSATKSDSNSVAIYKDMVIGLITDMLESDDLKYDDSKLGYTATIIHNGVSAVYQMMVDREHIIIDIDKSGVLSRVDITDMVYDDSAKPNFSQDAENAVLNVTMTDDINPIKIDRINLYTGEVTNVTAQPLSEGNYNTAVLVEGTCTIDRVVYYEYKADTSIRFVYTYKAHHSYGEWRLDSISLLKEVRTCSVCQLNEYRNITYTMDFCNNMLANWFSYMKSYRDTAYDTNGITRVMEYNGRVLKDGDGASATYRVMDENKQSYYYMDIGDGQYMMVADAFMGKMPMMHGMLRQMLDDPRVDMGQNYIFGDVSNSVFKGKGNFRINGRNMECRRLHNDERDRLKYEISQVNCLPDFEVPQGILYCVKEYTATATSAGVARMYDLNAKTITNVDIPALTTADYNVTPVKHGHKYQLKTNPEIAIFVAA